MLKIGTGVALVNIAFSSPKNVALSERKVLQYTTLSKNLRHWTMGEIKT